MGSDPDLSLDQLIELERRAAEREAEAEAAAAHETDDGDLEAIVLPWWQRPFNIGVLVVTAAALAAMVGFLVGDAAAQPKHNAVDVGFLQDMREHHEQGVLMSLVFAELADTNPEVETVARTIARGQSLEVGRMIQMLRSFDESETREDASEIMAWMEGGHDGHGSHELDPNDYDDEFSVMPGMATSAQLDALEAASGVEADRLFVELMITHHLAGVEMAEYAAEHAANDEVLAFAEAIIHGQRGEVVELQNLID